MFHHQGVLPKGRSFTPNSGTKAVLLPKGRSSTVKSGTKVAVLLGMNRWGSFLLLSVPQSLFSMYHHQSVLPKGRSFTANSGTKAVLLPKGRCFTVKSGTKVAVLLGMNRYSSFLFLSVPQSLFSIWTDLKRSQGHQRGGEESGFG